VNNANNSGGGLFTAAKDLIDQDKAWAVTPVPYNQGTMAWSGTDFNTYVGNGFMNSTPSSRETMEFHEILHIVAGGRRLANLFVDLKMRPILPGMARNRTENIYQISKNCGTALPAGY